MFSHGSKIQILSDLEFQQAAGAVKRKLFQSDDPYDEPLVPRITEREILCEFMYELEPPLIAPFIDVSREFGDQGFFVSLIIDVQDLMPHHWYVPFEDIDAYHGIFEWGIENVTFSPNWAWGIISTPDDFAILGAEPTFMERLKNRVPNIEEQVEEFMIRRKIDAGRGLRTDWVPRILKHVYGEAKAKSLLKAYGFDD